MTCTCHIWFLLRSSSCHKQQQLIVTPEGTNLKLSPAMSQRTSASITSTQLVHGTVRRLLCPHQGPNKSISNSMGRRVSAASTEPARGESSNVFILFDAQLYTSDQRQVGRSWGSIRQQRATNETKAPVSPWTEQTNKQTCNHGNTSAGWAPAVLFWKVH